MQSDPICSSAGCVSKQKASHPMDYFVPNFAVDQDIIDSQNNEAAAIKSIKGPAKKPAEAPKAPAKAEETKFAAKKPAASAKLMLESDPNCNSIECFTHHTLWEKGDDPVQYPISSEETLDDDIKATHQHL